MALHAKHRAVEHGVDIIGPALERARREPPFLQRGQQCAGQRRFAAAGGRRGQHTFDHSQFPVTRKTGLFAISRCSPPAGRVRLTAICVTCAASPWAVSAAAAAESVSSAIAEMQIRADGLRASAASTTPAMPPPVPPMKTTSGAGSPASASGARPCTGVIFHAPNRSRFRADQRAGVCFALHRVHAAAGAAGKASSTLTLPVPAPTSQQTSPGRTASLPKHGAHLLLCHRHLPACKRAVRNARRALRRAGRGLGQQHAQRCKRTLRALRRGGLRHTLVRIGKVLPHRHGQPAQARFAQLRAQRGRAERAAREEKHRSAAAHRRSRVARRAVGGDERPVLPGAAQTRGQKLPTLEMPGSTRAATPFSASSGSRPHAPE